MSTPNILELKSKLDNVYRAARDGLSDVDFEKTPQHLIVVALCCRMIELAEVFLSLMGKKGAISALPGIVRSLLEAYADLINLKNDPRYLAQMKSSFYRMKKKIAHSSLCSSQENPYLAPICDEVDVETLLQEIDDEIEECIAEGAAKRFTIEDKFSKAGLVNEYQSVYVLLCNHAHNNIFELERRHIEICEKRLTIHLFSETKPEELYGLVDIVGACLVGTLHHVCEMMGTEAPIAADEALDDLRRLYSRSI